MGPKKKPVEAYLADLAPSGRPAMRSSLHQIAAILDPRRQPTMDLDTFPWAKLRRDDTQRVRGELQRRYQPRSANRMLSALRQVLRRCWQDQQLPYEEYRLTADIKPIPVRAPSSGKALDQVVIDKLVTAASVRGGLLGARDAALVATMYAAGLRRIEASRADAASYDRRTQEISVIGKGGYVRIVPLIPGWTQHLEYWLGFVAPDGVMFPRIKRDRLDARMSADDVGVALQEIQESTPIGDRVDFTPHDLRRSFGTHLLDSGVDIALVKDLMGHANIQTTTIYDKRGVDAKRRAVAMVGRGTKP